MDRKSKWEWFRRILLMFYQLKLIMIKELHLQRKERINWEEARIIKNRMGRIARIINEVDRIKTEGLRMEKQLKLLSSELKHCNQGILLIKLESLWCLLLRWENKMRYKPRVFYGEKKFKEICMRLWLNREEIWVEM